MNVFVLCTGRCGSTTIIAACQHIRNYTAAHESRMHLVGPDRLNYPSQHIEADNRLSWLLGRLDSVFGDNAIYVHLRRDDEATARSFVNRWNRGIIGAYHRKIIGKSSSEPIDVCRDYCETVNRNIELFLRDKTHTLTMRLESMEADFVTFWEKIGAQGDLEQALAQLRVKHNASPGKLPFRQLTNRLMKSWTRKAS